MADPFGRAIRDHHEGERSEPLWQVDGEEALAHPIESFYVEPRDPDGETTRWLESRLAGPLLDVGAGVGRDALYFGERMETVALEVSEHLVAVMDDRGVRDARHGDMFDLPATVERGRFRSVRAAGTQLGLVRSRGRLRAFLDDLARVTTPDATAILDNYDPDRIDDDMLGYRPVPDDGLAFRTFHFEYEGDRGRTLLFRLFSPDRLRAACTDTDWRVREVRYFDERRYDAVLAKA
jgi:SAM-dependent methyltransferase